MNCDDYLSMLATLPVDELAYGHARDHASACPDCDRVTRVVAARERNMRLAFDSLQPSVPVEQTVFRAMEASRRRRIARYYELALGVAMAAGLVGLATLKRATPAPVATVSETFRLQCLSPDQATEVLRPYLSAKSSISIPSRSTLAVIVVRGSGEDLRNVRTALERYDNATESQCAVRVTVPKTP